MDTSADIPQIEVLYRKHTGHAPQSVTPIAGGGGARRYYRVADAEANAGAAGGETLVAAVGTNAAENAAFMAWSRFFARKGLPVPAVRAVDDSGMVYLQDDCGSETLHAFVGANPELRMETLRRVILELPRIQFSTVGDAEAAALFAQSRPQAMDGESVMFDLNYFKYCFLKLKGVEFDECALQTDFNRLAADLCGEGDVDTFLYRDFQSRNVLLKGGRPYFIDFQGGRRGPIYYDVASFLWQSSLGLTAAERDTLAAHYLAALQPYRAEEAALFMRRLHLFALFRVLQTLGAYGFRGLWEKKPYFTASIPAALRNLRDLCDEGVCDHYPQLKKLASALGTVPDTAPAVCTEPPALQVRVNSFAFKNGIPADPSGHGGGYVFDCRGTHNPGRYEAYKNLTGLDRPVIDFLEADGEITAFLESVYRIVDFHVARFVERGFTHLQVSFGCTGGQHRSVYCAQHLAERLASRHGVTVTLNHREQNITQTLTPQP